MSLYDVHPMGSRAQAKIAPTYEYGGAQAGTSMQKGYSGTADRATAFQNRELGHGRPLAMSNKTRGGLYKFEDDSPSNPFQK